MPVKNVLPKLLANSLPKLFAVARLCNSPKYGSERFLAQLVLAGQDPSLSFDWLLRLYSQNDVDRLARRSEVRTAARAGLSELAPIILANRCYAAWREEARQIIADDKAGETLRKLGFVSDDHEVLRELGL
jgi:hypothetical protein